MTKTYQKPELTLIGKADKIVMGHPSFGSDIDALMLIRDMEFEEDEE